MATWPDPRSISVGFAFGHSQYEDPTGLTFETVSPDPDDDDDPGPVLDGLTIQDGRIGDAPDTSPTRVDLTMRNDDGEFSPNNVSGSRYGTLRMGTPLQGAIDLGDGPAPLATAYALDFLPSTTGPDVDPQVQVPALGLLNRLSRDVDRRSALRRFYSLTSLQPFGYWPMDEANNATSAASGITRGTPLNFLTGLGRFNPGTTDARPGGATSGIQCIASYFEDPGTGMMQAALTYNGTGELAVDMWFAGAPASSAPDGTDGGSFSIELDFDDGTLVMWLEIDENNGDFSGASVAIPGFTSADVTQVGLLDGRPHHLYVSLHNSGANMAGAVAIDGVSHSVSITGWNLPTSQSQLLLTMPNGADWVNSTDSTEERMPVTFFGLAIYDDQDADSAYEAGTGHAGEQAHERITRVMTEAGIPFTTDATSSVELGPQPVGTVLEICRDAEATDGGVLYEAADGRLAFQSSRERYNAAVAVSLSWNDIVGAWPGNRDRDLYNRITVTRPDGVSATAELTSGPLGTDTSEGVGPRPLPVNRNVAGDPADVAHWLLHQKTIGKSPYQVIIDLTAEPTLASDVLGCKTGSRIQITDVPAEDHGPEDLDLIIEGRQITLDGGDLLVVWSCEPYAPWDVGAYGGENQALNEQWSGSVATGGAGVAANLDLTGRSIDLTGRMLRLSLTVDDPSKVAGMSFFLGVGGLTNTIRWTFFISQAAAASFKPGEQTTIVLQLAELRAVAGTITLSAAGVPSVTSGFTDARLAVTDDATGVVNVTLHSVEVVKPSRPGAFLSITFDDGWESPALLGFPKMAALGLRGTQYPIVELVGDTDRITMAELQAMNDAGWEIGGHSYAAAVHTARYTGVTAAAAAADMASNLGWLEANFPSDLGHTMAYPNGEYDETTDATAVESIVASAGYVAGRTTMSNPGSPGAHLEIESLPSPIVTRLYSSGLSSLATGQLVPANLLATGGMLDKLESNGGWLILFFHKISTGAPGDTNTISQADFDAVMESIAGRNITVLPVREVFDLLTPKKRYDTLGSRLTAGLWLDGTAGAYASCPTTTDAAVSSTLTVRADCALTSWVSGATQTLVAKYLATGNQISWRFQINSLGRPQFTWSPDGTGAAEVFATSTVAVPALPGERIALRVTFDLNDGAGHYRARFYYIVGGSDDLSGSAPWVLLDTVTGASTTTIFSGTAPITVGTRDSAGVTANATGLIRQATITGAGNVGATFINQPTGTTTFSESGETWTVSGSAKIYRRVTAGTDTSLLVATSAGPAWTTKATSWVGLQVEAGGAVWAVSSIAGSSLTQVMTVDAVCVNGVAKGLDPDTQIRVAPQQRATRGL